MGRNDALFSDRFFNNRGPMQPQAAKKRFSVDEYYKMARVGILRDEVPNELIDGEIIEMSPMGSRYAAAVSRISHRLGSSMQGKALLRIQLPLRLDAYNEPQPDISFVKVRRDFYEFRHPGPADVLFVLEIFESSFNYSRDIKSGVYAAVRIPEFWLLDLANSALLVFRGPSLGDYKTFLKFQRGDSLSMLAFPEIEIAVSDLLGTVLE